MIEKRKNFVINCFYFGIILALVVLVFRYGIFWVMPFVIGFGIAFLLKPLITLLSEKLHFPRKLAAALLVLLFYGIIGTLLTLLGVKLFLSAKNLFFGLPDFYQNSIVPYLNDLLDQVNTWAAKLDPSLVASLESFSDNAIQSIGSNLSQMSVKAVEMISGLASSVPNFLIQVLFSIISSFFIAMDYYKITSFLVRQLPEKGRELVFDIKNYVVGTLFKFIKSYALIMSITFVELSIGLTILGVENSILIALLIAIFDILPVLGTGGIMIPWIVLSLLQGNYVLALGLLIIYVVITIIRNIIEPKIVGQQIGIHPLVTLMSMFLGVKLFGGLGLFLLPISVVIIKNLNDSGKIKLFR